MSPYRPPQSNRMIRYFVAAIIGVIIAVGFFMGLAMLIAEPEELVSKKKEVKSFDFIRHKSDNELKARSRVKPPKPKKTPPPPEPKMNLATKASKPKLSAQKIDMPKINLPTNFKGDLLSGANVGSGNMEVIPLVRITPMYPKKAKRLKKEGYVTLQFTIDTRGLVIANTIKVIASEPKELFDASAKRAIKKWKFKPRLVGGKPVEQEGQQTINFTLREQ